MLIVLFFSNRYKLPLRVVYISSAPQYLIMRAHLHENCTVVILEKFLSDSGCFSVYHIEQQVLETVAVGIGHFPDRMQRLDLEI